MYKDMRKMNEKATRAFGEEMFQAEGRTRARAKMQECAW